MRSRRANLLMGILFCLFFSAEAQKISIESLLDSAELLWYVDYDKTDKLVKKAEELTVSLGHSGHESHLIQLYDLRIQSCIAFSKLQLWRQYIDEFEGLISKYMKELGPEEYTLFRLKNEKSRAQYYFEINDDAEALGLFVKLLEEFKRLPSSQEVCLDIYGVCNYIAVIHSRRGEFAASINQHVASIQYFECATTEGASKSYRSLIYRNIGHDYLQGGDYKQAGMYLKLAENSLQTFFKQSPESLSRIALSLYETQASYYERIGRHDSALFAMQKTIPLLKLRNVEDAFKGRVSQSLGSLYVREGKLSEARNYYDQAENYFLNSQEGQAFYLSNVYLLKAALLEKQKKIEDALEYCSKAIEKLVVDFKPDVNDNPSLQSVLSKKQLFKVLQKKSELLEKLSGESQDIAVLLRALSTNQLSLALLDSTVNEYGLDKDKIILSEQSYSAFEGGIRISNTLYQKTGEEKYFTYAISLIEKSKGNLLLENLRLVNRFSGIKQEWLEQEKELKAEMLLTEQSLYESELKIKKPETLQQLRERYGTIKRNYSSLIEQIKHQAPAYYKLRFDHSVISTEALQNELLKPGEALIEFFVGDSILAVAGFTNEKKYLNVKKVLPDFTEKMNRFRTLLTTRNSDFLEIAAEFYNFLLKDCLIELGPEIKSLIVIPDGLLGYLPFEVLIQSKDSKVVYLNDQVSIRYANSATYLMEQMNRQPSDSKNFFAGFVSSGSDQSRGNNKQWATLPGAEREVALITELFSSKFTTFNPANKRDFINHASDYKILHFAMHSSVNDYNPMMSVMVFSEADSAENLLTAIELYSMKLNSEMAVLSACNTGVGQLHRGEGIMSFSRAFAYAGVPSAVISLWKVPDVATSKIMVSFYSYLKKGETKDKALQLARQDFIRNNPEMSHPYFWSGFILTGNAEPIDFPSSTRWIWIVAALMLVLTGLYFGRMRLMRGAGFWN